MSPTPLSQLGFDHSLADRPLARAPALAVSSLCATLIGRRLQKVAGMMGQRPIAFGGRRLHSEVDDAPEVGRGLIAAGNDG